MRESVFSAKVMRWLRAIPEVAFCTRVESGAVSPGIPDVYLIYRGSHIWLELKTETGKLRTTQTLWHKVYLEAGGMVDVITPAHIGSRAQLELFLYMMKGDWNATG